VLGRGVGPGAGGIEGSGSTGGLPAQPRDDDPDEPEVGGLCGTPMPTARSTEVEKLATDTVSDEVPRLPPFFPGCPAAWRNASRDRRSLADAVVASDRIGSPIVTQRTATSGSASTNGSARDRERVSARAEGRRLGRRTYERRIYCPPQDS